MLDLLTKKNLLAKGELNLPVYSGWLNYVLRSLNDLNPLPGKLKVDTIDEVTASQGISIDGILLKDSGISLSPNVTEYVTEVTLGPGQIVGSAVGQIGHTGGAILVPALSSNYCYEFVDAVFIYDFGVAAYTGGANDLQIRVGTVAQTSSMTGTNCLLAAGDKVYSLSRITTETSLQVGTTINLKGTAYTNPGTAVGVLRIQLRYRVHATGL